MSTPPKGRRYRYRQHKRSARVHFENRWKQRVGTKPPPWEPMCAEFRKARGGGSNLLRLYRWDYHSTQWKTPLSDGRTALIRYDHGLKQPVTVWLATQDKEMWENGHDGYNVTSEET